MKRFVLADGAKEKIGKIFEKEGIQKKEVAERLGISPSGLCNKIRGVNSSFSERELETLLYTFPEIREAWFKQSYRYGDHVTAKSVIPTAIEVKRISKGYEAQFTGIDGKLHSAYGKTELEARKKAEERMASITVKQEETLPDDKAVINISGDEAMVLLNQLILDFRNGAVSEANKSILKSIYMRIAVQII